LGNAGFGVNRIGVKVLRRRRANKEFKRLHGGARIIGLSYC